MIVNKSWQQNQGLLSFLYSLWCKYVEVGSLMAKKKTKQKTKTKKQRETVLFEREAAVVISRRHTTNSQPCW